MKKQSTDVFKANEKYLLSTSIQKGWVTIKWVIRKHICGECNRLRDPFTRGKGKMQRLLP